LHQKMKQLIDERAGVIKQVVEAREMGDLSENAEYHAAREKQRAIENEYNRLKTRISQLQVLDPAKLSKDAARFGARVHIKCLDTGEEIYLQLVGVDEIFKSEDKYERTSILSPRGKAIIGKKIGDLVTVIAPIGEFRYEILSIE
jgi:transcription elongation factor GreA